MPGEGVVLHRATSHDTSSEGKESGLQDRKSAGHEHDPYQLANSCVRSFDDPESFAQTIPGGRFGLVPVEHGGFEATLRVSSLTDGVAVRGVSLSHSVALRSEFTGGNNPSATFLFPVRNGRGILLDGRSFSDDRIVSRIPGQTPSVRTNGATEIGGIVVRQEAVRQIAEVIYGREFPEVFLNPASFRPSGTEHMAALRHAYLCVNGILQGHSHARLSQLEQTLIKRLRESVVIALLEALVGGEVKRDHLAHQRQTACMARIERLIDERREDPIGLQDLCEGAGLALRTAEAIIRNRTGMTALQYLQRRYLAFARESLLRAESGATVTKIAMQNGFFHLGRFAGFYRSIYGETPSTTLLRAMG